jgi:membrane peptidoglycan carboxypeptidase
MAINRTYSLARNPGNRDAPNTVNPLLTGTNVSPGYQAGSTFKMFTLVAALESGLPLATRIVAPDRIKTPFRNATGPVACDGDHWCPRNAAALMAGTHTMWSGYGESVNTFFVQLEQKVTVKAAVNTAEKLGITFRSSVDIKLKDFVQSSPNGAWGSFTLGTPLVTPLDMANAYATVAARGKRCEPLPVLRLLDRDGVLMRQSYPNCRQVIPPDVADAAADAARCPVGDPATSSCSIRNGVTARRVGAQIDRPIAGKTGTTDSNKAAWFIGFTPNLAAAVFFADPDNPNKRPVPTYRVPVSVYLDTMQTALKRVPVVDFVPPTHARAWGVHGAPTLSVDPAVGDPKTESSDKKKPGRTRPSGPNPRSG